MRIFKPFLVIACVLLMAASSFAQSCSSGCTIVVSSETSVDYTLGTGEQLCITATGIISGNITLNGGSICNQGLIQSPLFIINNGTINNYGTILQANVLELKNTSILTNYSGGIIKVSQKLIVGNDASYLAERGAQLIVFPFATMPLMANAGAPQTICSSTSSTLGGQPTAAGGTGPYTYSWAPSTGLDYTNIANPVAKPTTNTTYTLTVTDALGKIRTSTVAITVMASPVANAGSPQTVCKGATVTLGGSPSATGGTTPYKYVWTLYEGLNNDSVANPTANPNYTTTYVLSVVDNNKCYGTSSVVITVKPEIALFAGNDSTILKRDTMLLGGNPTATYGTPPFTYSWSPSTGLNSTTVTNPKASPSATTSYILTVSDAGGCGSKKDTVVVTVDPNPKVFAGLDAKICSGDTVKLGGNPTAKGGTLPYTYSWSPSTGLSGSTIANPKAYPASTTSYVLTVTDGASIVRKDTVIVTVRPKPTANAGSDVTTTVANATLGATPAATGGTPPYRYDWSPHTDVIVNNTPNPFVQLKDTVTFTLIVTDTNGCVGVDQVVYNYRNITGSSCNLDSCTYTVSTTSSTNYTINSGQKLCILPGGKVTGTITLNSGGRICNSGIFTPGSFVFNGGTLTNNAAATTKITGNLIIVSGAGIVNDGYFEVTGYFKSNSGSNVLNTGSLKTSGRMLVQNANFSNTGYISLNTTSLVITSPGTVTNDGTIMGIDTVKNSSTLKMGDNAVVLTKHFYNYSGAVTKKITTPTSTKGSIVVCSRTENAGQINDSIDICDQSPPGGGNLDLNTGTIQGSVSYCKNKVNGADEACGTCATIAIMHTGCAGDMAAFTAVSTKVFEYYEFFKNSVSVQLGKSNVYQLPAVAVPGDTIKVIGYSNSTTCKVVTSIPYVIPTRPVVSISGSDIATGASVVLTASGAHKYKWTQADGTSIGSTAAVTVYPFITTTYIVTGTDTVKGCNDVETFEVKKPLTINYTVQNPSITSSSTAGSITLNINGGKLPFTYSWSNGSTSPVLTPATVNTTYSVTVTDASSQTATASITVGYAASWANTTGVSLSGSDISKTAAGNAWGTAGTSSATVIGSGQNGWVEFVYNSSTDTYSVGLGTGDSNGQADAIAYAYRVVQNGLFIYESGVQKAVFISSPKIGDVLRVERNGSSILYKKNGTTYFTGTVSSSAVIVANTAIYNSGGKITAFQGGFTDLPATKYHDVLIGIPDNPVVFPVCTGDGNKNFTQTVFYDDAGNKAAEQKVYVDYWGRTIQKQERNLSENDVLATQMIYDYFGRPVLITLAAPINQTDLCYKQNFITSSSTGVDYSNTDFNVPDYTKSPLTLWSGEVDRPIGVGNTIPNSLGWYYSNNNTIEPFVPASSFPYSRVEYDDNNDGTIKRSTQPGEAFTMGNGHETQTYQVSSLNELDYLYGQNKSWMVDDYTDPNYNGQGTITPAAISSGYRVVKTITIDQNGKELISFSDLGGNALATGYSGQVNGSNVVTRSVSRVFTNTNFADIHLPKGCESSLTLNNGGVYTILNLKTGLYVKFSNSIQFTGTTPNLPAGIYRITAVSGQTLSVTQNVNYYDFSINYYDRAGRLKLTIPPEGIDVSYTPSATPPAHKMFASNDFNSLGEVLSSTTADEKITLFLYRKDGKLRFSQNGKQRASNANAGLRRFNYINYDELGRVVETGEYDPALSGSNPLYYFDKLLPGTSAPGAGYTAVSSILESTSMSGANINAGGRCTQQIYAAYDVALSPPLSYVQKNVKGRISKQWNAASTSWYSYDELGRMNWHVQEIKDMPTTGSTSVKTINYKYDINGHVLEEAYQKENSSEDFYYTYEYDADKRLKKAYMSIDEGLTKQEIANYKYYRHGPLKRTELANKTQGIDNVYTINGWLKSINNPELDNQKDPGKDGITGGVSNTPADLFGMTLDYYSGDYSRANTLVQTYETPWSVDLPSPPVYSYNLYNGMIKGQRWRTVIPANSGANYAGNQLMYAYQYDNKYQFSTATFGTITSPGILNAAVYTPSGNGQMEQSPYRNKGPVFSAVDDYKVWNLTYDKNGNIKTLNRNSYAASLAGLSMDQLTYNYNLSGGRLVNNKLKNVVDAVSVTSPSIAENFFPGQTSGSDNYVYDDNGQQIEDNSPTYKEFTDYDTYGKITAVYSAAAKTPSTLKAKFTYDEKGFRIRKTDVSGKDYWYIRDAGGKLISMYEKPSAGSIAQTEVNLYGLTRVGVHYMNTGADMFELTDHLGNVRSTFNVAVNSSIKTYYDKEYKDDYLVNYNATIDNTQNHATSPANKTAAVKINTAAPYGPLLNIPIKTGQTVSGSYWYKTSGTSVPNAMMVFSIDDPITHQNINWDARPIVTASSGAWTELTFSVPIPKNGSLVVYPWNNDATQTVWFDDLTLTIANGGGAPVPVAKSLTDYYPHGSVIPGRDPSTLSSSEYRYRYQGQYAEQDGELDFKNNFELRQWNGLLGRWSSKDPKYAFPNPYVGMGNNPISNIDPDGADWYQSPYASYTGKGDIGIPDGGLIWVPGSPTVTMDGKEWTNIGSVIFYSERLPGGELVTFMGNADGSRTLLEKVVMGDNAISSYNCHGGNSQQTIEAAEEAYAAAYEEAYYQAHKYDHSEIGPNGEQYVRGMESVNWELFLVLPETRVVGTSSEVAMAEFNLANAELEAGMNAVKAETEGGLNLFKWGKEQTGRPTGWREGDYMLYLPNKGTPKLNWKANYGSLRTEMNLGKPIFDSYIYSNGELIMTEGFLNAERYILQSRGWIYNVNNRAWMPPAPVIK